MVRTLLLLSLCLGGCDILFPDDPPFTDCRITRITGTWQTTFEEIEGTCGPMPDTTELFRVDGELPVGCIVFTDEVSPDRCTRDRDYECPLPGFPFGGQHWVSSETMIGYDRIAGTAMAGISDGVSSCQSHYEILRQKL